MKLQESIRGILVRELRALQRELDEYGEEGELWQLPVGINNSAGTLALHLVGNLRAFVGATLGASDYVRDRDAEFSRRDVSRDEMIREIERTIIVVEETMRNLSDDQLSQPFPLAFGGIRVNTGDFLIHLATHLAFHVGQIDYHRRVVTGASESIAPLSIPELASVATTE